MLICMGHRTDLASSGLDALKHLAHQPYDIVLLDMDMAEIGGLEVTRIIRESWPPEEQPYIIALAARSLEYSKEACHTAGIDSVVHKPFQVEELEAELETVISSPKKLP